MILRGLLLLLFFVLTTLPTFAQSSLVPVYHEVYDWLHYQRISGNAERYNYEALPLTRGQITKVLNQIEPSALSYGQRKNLDSYLREFSTDSTRKYSTNSYIQGDEKAYPRIKNLILSEEEPHVYVWADDKSTIALDWVVGRGAVYVEDGEVSYNSPYYTYGAIRSYGTFYDLFGYHYEQWRAVDVGDDEAFNYIPFLTRNWKTLVGIGSNKHHLENFVGFSKDIFSLHIGRGMLKYGVGDRNNLVFSRESIPFDWIRFNINSKYVDYSVIHGNLSWKPVQSPLEGSPGQLTRVAPNRFTIHQRIQFQPTKWITFGFYELINYSNRKAEIAYINPVNRLSIMEWEMQDQDNGFAGFEGTLRPIKGLELFGEILIDDLGDAKDIFRFNTKFSNSNFARYAGINYATPIGLILKSTYQRIDPSMYAHKYALNAHAEKGIGLGSQVGPNAEEFRIGLEQWLTNRTRISFNYTYTRQGRNYTDDQGNFVDVGGSINDSYVAGNRKPTTFMAGDLHRWNEIDFGIQSDFWRGVRFSLDLRYRTMLEGEQLNDLFFINSTIIVGY
jgi:hypothetical protein